MYIDEVKQVTQFRSRSTAEIRVPDYGTTEGAGLDDIKIIGNQPELDGVISVWGNPHLEPNLVMSSFYRTIDSMDPNHPYKQMIYRLYTERNADSSSESTGENFANVMHRGLIHLANFELDGLLPETAVLLSKVNDNDTVDDWLELLTQVSQDPDAKERYTKILKTKNAMANKGTRYRSAIEFVEELNAERINMVTVIDLGASAGEGVKAMLTPMIKRIESQDKYNISNAVNKAYLIDIANDPFLDPETLKWIYSCSFQPGEERVGFEDWREKIVGERERLNGRFDTTYYETDAITAINRIKEDPESIPSTSNELVVSAHTFLYQLSPEQQLNIINSAIDLIKSKGINGTIIIADFFDGDVKLDGNGKLILPFTSKWRATAQNPGPYKVYALRVEDNQAQPPKLLDQWESGRCDTRVQKAI